VWLQPAIGKVVNQGLAVMQQSQPAEPGVHDNLMQATLIGEFNQATFDRL